MRSPLCIGYTIQFLLSLKAKNDAKLRKNKRKRDCSSLCGRKMNGKNGRNANFYLHQFTFAGELQIDMTYFLPSRRNVKLTGVLFQV